MSYIRDQLRKRSQLLQWLRSDGSLNVPNVVLSAVYHDVYSAENEILMAFNHGTALVSISPLVL